MKEGKLEISTLMDAMNECMVSELPEPLKDGDDRIWSWGIAKVEKVDFSKNYCVVKNDGYGNIFILHDFGHVASINKVLGVYPVAYLSESDMPDIRTKKDYTKYLVMHDENEDKVKYLLGNKYENGDTKTEEDRLADQNKIKAMTIRHAIDDVIYVIKNAKQQEEELNNMEEDKNEKGNIKKED